MTQGRKQRLGGASPPRLAALVVLLIATGEFEGLRGGLGAVCGEL
jgi:hypothetical protein